MGVAATFILVGWAAVAGLICGSFANVLVHRLPRGVFFAMGSRSRCPLCGHQIAWYDNLPILSWLILGGRCRSCRAPIPVRYPLVELAGGGLFLVVALRAWTGDLQLGSGFALLGFFLSLWLLAAAVIDLEHRILPDALTISGLVLAPGLVFLNPAGPGWPAELLPGAWGTLLASAAGILAGGGALWLVGVLGRVAFHKEAMGMGDVKLMAFMGGILGVQGVLLSILLACIVGALLGSVAVCCRRDRYLPFGPYLAGASLAVLVHGDTIRDVLTGSMKYMARERWGPVVLLGIALAGTVLLVFLRRSRGVGERDRVQ